MPACSLRRGSIGDLVCRGLDMTYAKGWLIMVGASRTSPVPGSGMRRRHARRRNLPSFRALLGDNTPTAALRGLRMITMAKCLHGRSLSCFLEVGEGKASSLLPMLYGLSLSGAEPFAWDSWGVYIGLPPRGTMVIRLDAGSAPVSLAAVLSADSWGPPTGRPRRLAWYGADRPRPPRAGLAGC